MDEKTVLTEEETTAASDDFDLSSFNLDDYKDHYTMRGRDKGCSEKLRGKVTMVSFLLNDFDSAWLPEEVEEFRQVLLNSMALIKNQSGFNDNELKLSYAMDVVPLQRKFDRNEPSGEVVKAVLKQYGYESASRYHQHYETKFKKNEAPLVFVLNKRFRSFAINRDSEKKDQGSEWGFVSYEGDIDRCTRTYVHELLHQFGAVDYYVVPLIKEAANEIFPDSIMNGGKIIDDYTKYLIGWIDEPTEKMARFLERIKDVTYEDYLEAYEADKRNDW